MNTIPVCDACDGNGSASYEWAKKRCVETYGRRLFTHLNPDEWYYETGDGKCIEFKSVGGYCSRCNGTGKELSNARTTGNHSGG